MSKRAATRTTLYLSEPVLDIIGETENTSARIKSLVLAYGALCRAADIEPDASAEAILLKRLERYGRVVAYNTPTLPEAEWLALCDSLRHEEVSELLSGETQEIEREYATALISKIMRLPLIERLAIVEVVARAWAINGLFLASPREVLRMAGAKIS